MADERIKAIELTFAQIEKQFGKGSIMRLGSKEAIAGNLPGVSTTRAVKSGRVHRVEEHDLVYIGPRTGENVLKLQELIHAGERTP